MLQNLFDTDISIQENIIILPESVLTCTNQEQTNEIFSDKWTSVYKQKDHEKFYEDQKRWFLTLYDFANEKELQAFLKSQKIIFDAGCGLGYKAAWFAELSPESIVIGMDLSEAVFHAANQYKNIKNLFFIQGDISNTKLKKASIDFILCDQVLHHTTWPEQTFKHLAQRLKTDGEFACYVYAKKALPRELLDGHFREFSKTLSHQQLWELSEQLTELGKKLSELDIKFECPDIPLLNIKGGEYDVQRFIYWNFIKCFWSDEFGMDLSIATNFDWYAPSNAKRFSEEEFKKMILDNMLTIKSFHKEEACYSGRFLK